MPLAGNALPTEVTVGVRDYNNEDSTASVFFPVGLALADIVGQIAPVEAVIAALTDGFIYGGGLSRRFNQTDDPPPEGAPISSDVQRKGVFVFENSFGTYNTYTIPSIDRALILAGSRQINRAAPAVAAYVALMTNQLAGVAGFRAIGGNGYNLVRLVDAYEDSRDKPNGRR